MAEVSVIQNVLLLSLTNLRSPVDRFHGLYKKNDVPGPGTYLMEVFTESYYSIIYSMVIRRGVYCQGLCLSRTTCGS